MERLIDAIENRISGKAKVDGLQEYARVAFQSDFQYNFPMCIGDKIDSDKCKEKAKQVA